MCRSLILGRRPKDRDATRGFTKWPFMTTHMWAESPRGRWTLTVSLEGASADDSATVSELTLMLHGTRVAPYSQQGEDSGIKHPKLEIVKRAHRKWANMQAAA